MRYAAIDRRMLRGVASLSSGRLGASLVAAAWLVIVARTVGPGPFGELSLVLGVGAVAGTLGDLGLPFVLSSAVAEHGSCSLSTVRFVQRRRLPAAVVAAGATIVMQLLLIEDPEPLVGVLLGVTLVCAALSSTALSALRGFGRTGLESAGEVAARVLTVSIGLPMLLLGGGIVSVALAYASASLVQAGITDRLARRQLVDVDGIDRRLFGMRRTVGTSVARILAAGQRRADIAVVTAVGGTVAGGLYGAPFRIFEAILVPARAFGALAAGGARPANPRRAAVAVGVAMAVPVCVLIPAASWFVPVLLGDAFEAATGVTQVLLLAVVPASVSNALLPRLSVDAGWAVSVVLGSVTALALGFDVMVVGVHGAVGAAWVTVISECVVAGLALTLSRRRLPV